jgi:DNA/RNA endonuclease G (NUC1)
MKIVEKNEGRKIDYTVSGTKLNFADGELTLNLARYQQDESVTKDIMVDNDGYLTTGHGRYYAAQVEIPAAEYKEIATQQEDSESSEGTMHETVERERLPLDMSKVTLYLFSVEGIIIY